MYLQLAEGTNDGNYTQLAEEMTNALDMYVFIPANFLPEFNKDTYVRADFFNKYDTDTANEILTALNKYQMAGVNEGAIETAVNFIPGFGPVASKGINVAKQLIEKRKEKVKAGTAQPLIKPGSKFANLLQKLKPESNKIKSEQETKKDPIINTPVGASLTLPGGQFNVGYNPTPPPTQQSSFFERYKTPLLIGGGILAIGGLYMMMKKK